MDACAKITGGISSLRWHTSPGEVAPQRRSPSPASSSSSLPSPRVLSVVPKKSFAATQEKAREIRRPVIITPEFSDSDEEENGEAARRETERLVYQSSGIINNSHMPAVLDEEPLGRRRSQPPRVLPCRTAAMSGRCLTRKICQGVLKCGSKLVSFAGSCNGEGLDVTGVIWYAPEEIESHCNSDLKGRIVVVDHDLALIRPVNDAGALAIVVARDDVKRGCWIDTDYVKVPLLAVSREDIVQARIRPLSHVTLCTHQTGSNTLDSENRVPDNSADGVIYQRGSKGHKPVKAVKAQHGSALPAVLSIMQTPNGTRKVRRLDLSSSDSEDGDVHGRFRGAAENSSSKALATEQRGNRQAAMKQVEKLQARPFDLQRNVTESEFSRGSSTASLPRSSGDFHVDGGVVGLLERWGSHTIPDHVQSSMASSATENGQDLNFGNGNSGGTQSAASLTGLQFSVSALSPQLLADKYSMAAAETSCQVCISSKDWCRQGGHCNPVARALSLSSSAFSASASAPLSPPQFDTVASINHQCDHDGEEAVRKLVDMDPVAMARNLEVLKVSKTPGLRLEWTIETVAGRVEKQLRRCETSERKQDGAKRLRELCRFQREKDENISNLSWRIVDHIMGKEESVQTLAQMLETRCRNPGPRQRGQCACIDCEEQKTAAACVQHLALDDTISHLLATNTPFMSSLASSLSGRTCSQVRHRAAACVANLALEHNDLRELLCSNRQLLCGLESLFSHVDPQSMDFSLAAFANLSIDPRQARKIMNHVRMHTIVMVLTIGSPKSQHRAAGLIRNLLLCKESLVKISRVPGIIQSLEKLESPETCSETRMRAAVALSMIRALPKTDHACATRLEEKLLVSTGNDVENNLVAYGSDKWAADQGYFDGVCESVSLDEDDSCEMYGDGPCDLDIDPRTLEGAPLLEVCKQTICVKGSSGQKAVQSAVWNLEQEWIEHERKQEQEQREMVEMLRVKKREMLAARHTVRETNPVEQSHDHDSHHQPFFPSRMENKTCYPPALTPRGEIAVNLTPREPSTDAKRALTPREPNTDLCVNHGYCMVPGTRPQASCHVQRPPFPLGVREYKVPAQALHPLPQIPRTSHSAPVTPRVKCSTPPPLEHLAYIVATTVNSTVSQQHECSDLLFHAPNQAGAGHHVTGFSATAQLRPGDGISPNHSKASSADNRSCPRSPSIFGQVSKWFRLPSPRTTTRDSSTSR